MFLDRFRLAGIGPFRSPQAVSLGPLVFLVGNNGTGKSTFLRAINVFREFGRLAAVKPVLESLPVASGLPEFSLGLDSGDVRIDLTCRSADGVVVRETISKGAYYFRAEEMEGVAHHPAHPGGEYRIVREIESDLLAIGSYQRYVAPEFWGDLRSIRLLDPVPSAVAEGQSPSSDPEAGGFAAMNFASASPEVRSRIEDTMRVLQPDLVTIHAHEAGGRAFVNVETRSHEERPAASMSDGFLRAFAIVTALRTLPDGTLLLLEEPETSLHFDALSVLSDEMLFASRRMQIVATTHSPELLSSDRVTSDMIVTLRPSPEGTIAGRMSEGLAALIDSGRTTAGEELASGVLTEAFAA